MSLFVLCFKQTPCETLGLRLSTAVPLTQRILLPSWLPVTSTVYSKPISAQGGTLGRDIRALRGGKKKE